MWKVTHTQTISHGKQWLVQNTRNGGYLSLNGDGGGALHFGTEAEAEEVAYTMNHVDWR